MRLIKKLERRQCWKENTKRMVGLFECEYCGSHVEKEINHGKRLNACGCLPQGKIIHDLRWNPIYETWLGIKSRCYYKNNKGYKNYGGRGIKICDEWLDPVNFIKWASENGYRKDLTIDRINNDGNYEPNNCQWVTQKINGRHTRQTKLTMEKANLIRKLIIHDGFTSTDLARIFGVCYSTIRHIINGRVWAD